MSGKSKGFEGSAPTMRELRPLLRLYESPHPTRGWLQILSAVGPFIASWWFMYELSRYSVFASLFLAPIAAAFMLRTFVLFHDCAHGSLFRHRSTNELVGFVLGVICLTPYHQWRRTHLYHHSHAGNLDKRGVGEIYTMTVAEYREASRTRRLLYRIFRHPLVLFGVIPSIVFLILYRLPSRISARRERFGLVACNLAIVALACGMVALTGLRRFIAVELPIEMIATGAGAWLFYVQHNFEDTYAVHDPEWSFAEVGMKGSSYYKLPRLLQWFSANIGFHHIHHLSPSIPNYRVEQCHLENPVLQVRPLTLFKSLGASRYRLWDEDTGRMTGLNKRNQ